MKRFIYFLEFYKVAPTVVFELGEFQGSLVCRRFYIPHLNCNTKHMFQFAGCFVKLTCLHRVFDAMCINIRKSMPSVVE